MFAVWIEGVVILPCGLGSTSLAVGLQEPHEKSARGNDEHHDEEGDQNPFMAGEVMFYIAGVHGALGGL